MQNSHNTNTQNTLTTFLFCCFLVPFSLFAQTKTVITGKVLDGETSEGMPFVNVYFKGTSIGATTNFDGYFSITTTTPTDSLVASSIGYRPKSRPVLKGKTQEINFNLLPDAQKLEEVTVSAKRENPAWDILRAVVRNKKKNDAPNSLQAYEYDRYSRVELDADNLSEGMSKKKIVRKIIAAIDSIGKLTDEDGGRVVPMYISEELSKYYYRKNPDKIAEIVYKTKTTGILLDNNGFMSQVIATTFQNYNFYDDWLKILNKDIVSPIADSWRQYYDYTLRDSLVTVAGVPCYEIKFKALRPQDLAFTGIMWIEDSTFALRQIDVKLGKEANMNFIEKIKVQQECVRVGKDFGYLPSKTRVLIDVSEIKANSAGLLVKSYVSCKNFVGERPLEADFYKERRTIAPDSKELNEIYWEKNRHDSLTQQEKQIFQMVDTIKKLPIVRSYVEVIDILINGYKRFDKWSLGTYINTFAYNNIEGARVRIGFRTGNELSRKIRFEGYAAYGFMDKRFKYKLQTDYVIAKRPWTQLSLIRTDDMNQIAFFSEIFKDNNMDFTQNDAIFRAFTLWGNVERRRPFLHKKNEMIFMSELFRGFTQRVGIVQQRIIPLFPFQYIDTQGDRTLKSEFNTTELLFESRWAIGENAFRDGFSRLSLGTSNRPIITLQYVMGLRGVLGSDLAYHKFFFRWTHNARLGGWGRTLYTIYGSYIPTTLPYPLLETHLGNQSPFFNRFSFNLMNYFEFISDRYASINIIHNFEGALFNRIPLLRRLKWREVFIANVLYGSVKPENFDLIVQVDSRQKPFQSLGKEPYVEVGYGIENIFKFLRITAFHRLTYLDRPNAKAFGIRASIHVKL